MDGFTVMLLVVSALLGMRWLGEARLTFRPGIYRVFGVVFGLLFTLTSGSLIGGMTNTIIRFPEADTNSLFMVSVFSFLFAVSACLLANKTVHAQVLASR